MPRVHTYDVDQSWSLPDFTSTLPAVAAVSTEESTLRASFFDTADRALHHRGIRVTLTADQCHVQLPDSDISVASTGRAVPREIQQLLQGVRRGQRLVVVAKTETHRRVTRLIDASGAIAAEITDDAVTATAIDAADVIEVRREIALRATDKELRRGLAKALTKAGAHPVTRPDEEPVVALLSLRASAHTLHAPSGTLARLVADYLDEQYDALLDADLALRSGADVVHAARVATRRFRSVLRVFSELFDAERASACDVELQWYAEQLGMVRDAEVQRAHLAKAVAALPTELVIGAAPDRIQAYLLAQHDTAQAKLARTMRSARYLALLTELESWHEQPPVTAAAARPAKASAEYLRRAQRTLAKRLRAVDHGDEETLHRARKAAKRSRYAAELAEPVLGKSAKKAVARAKSMQDVLGEHQDSVVACEVLLALLTAKPAPSTAEASAARSAGARQAPDSDFTIGLLYQRERDRAHQLRSQAIKAAHR